MPVLDSYVPDNLFGGHVMPQVTDTAIIDAGQTLARGALLGRVTASNKLKLVDKAATDGSQDVYAVLSENVDTTAGEERVTVYLTGEFNENALTVESGNTVAEHKISARARSIFIKSVVKA